IVSTGAVVAAGVFQALVLGHAGGAVAEVAGSARLAALAHVAGVAHAQGLARAGVAAAVGVAPVRAAGGVDPLAVPIAPRRQDHALAELVADVRRLAQVAARALVGGIAHALDHARLVLTDAVAAAEVARLVGASDVGRAVVVVVPVEAGRAALTAVT